jgi:membrane associated rhomboid family serine protease
MGRLAGSPTVSLLAVLGVVFLFASVLGPEPFALALPVETRPWTVVTNVYAHYGLEHLVANAVALAVLGLAVERATTAVRFHLFFLATGVLSALAEVGVADALGRDVAVLGASGAVFALLGYVLVANPVSRSLLSHLDADRPLLVVAAVGLAALFTLLAAAPGVALVAHFVGLLAGLVAGRARILHV